MTVSGADLVTAIGLQPKEAVRYLQGKSVRVTGGWRELDAAAHAKAFTVANVAKADVLSDIHAELQRHLRNGGTLEQFKDALVPRLQVRGWWKREGTTAELAKAGRVDPATGEIAKGLTPHRLKTIFQTNMQSAYMAGRYRQQLEEAEERPFWQYVAILDARTRPAHRAMNGRIFRFDDPGWKSFYPPCGYNCRCRVRTFSERDVSRRKLEVGSTEGKLSQVEVPQADGSSLPATRYTDPALPGGKFQPDPGFDGNPGARFPQLDRAQLRDAAAPAARKAAGPVVREASGQTTWKDLDLPDLRAAKPNMPRAPELLPRAATREAAARQVIEAVGLKDTPMRRIDTPVGDVILRREFVEHVVEKATDARERFARYILPTLENPYEVWLTMYTDGRPRRRFIGLYEGEKYDVLVVCRQNTDGAIFWNLMHADAKQLNRLRAGKLLWGK